MGKIIAFTNQKGGVGKTTSAINVATSLAVSELKTIIIDLDPQANTTTGFSDLFKNKKSNIYNVLIEKKSLSSSIVKTKLKFLDIVPSTNDLVGAEIELVSMMGREYKLKECLGNLQEKYDYIILDCPPSLGLLTLNALSASDSVLIPIQCEYFALEGLSQLLQTVRLVQRHLNKNLDIEGVLITMYDSRLNLCKQVEKEVREHFDGTTFKTMIRRNVRLSEAPSFGKPILLYDANSTGAQDYLNLVQEIINREKK